MNPTNPMKRRSLLVGVSETGGEPAAVDSDVFSDDELAVAGALAPKHGEVGAFHTVAPVGAR